jgi:hypothetical protein
MTAASGNSSRARARVVATFAPRWAPWRWCRARSTYARRRCQLTRRHFGRHAWCDGFNVHYFDTPRDGTP